MWPECLLPTFRDADWPPKDAAYISSRQLQGAAASMDEQDGRSRGVPLPQSALDLRIGLFAPPIAEPFQPCLTLPYLGAQVEALGFQVARHDLTGMFYFWLARRLKWESAQRYQRVTRAMGVLRDEERFYDRSLYDDSMEVLTDHIAEVAEQDGLPYTLFPAASVADAEGLAELIGHMPGTQLEHFLVDYVGFTLRLEAYDVIAVSAMNTFQLAASLFIAEKLKRAGIRGHIVLGGHALSAAQEVIPKVAQFAAIDSLVVHGDARVFAQVCDDLVAGRAERLYEGSGRNDRQQAPFGFSVTEPCNVVLPRDVLEFYLSPSPIFSVYSASGCSYGKCVFCSSNRAVARYVPRNIDVLLDEVEALVNTWKVSHFVVCDNNFAPERIRAFSDGLGRRGLDIAWQCTSRVCDSLDLDLLRRMRASGCVLLSIGLESASDRVLTSMRKGYTIRHVTRLLEDMRRVGLPAHLYCICRFPGEAAEDSQLTADFLVQRAESYQSVYFQDYCVQLAAGVFEPAHASGAKGWSAEELMSLLQEEAALRERFYFHGNLMRRRGYPAVEEHNFLYLSHRLRQEDWQT